MNRFSEACRDYGLTINLKKTQVLGQDVDLPPSITISDHVLEVVHGFVYLGSTISDSFSLVSELNKSMGKSATTFFQTDKESMVQQNADGTYQFPGLQACVVNTLLYGSVSWTPRARQERKLNVFHLGYLPRIINITWQDRVSNNKILERAGTPSMYTLLKQRRLRWPGQLWSPVVRMDDSRIPKDLLYGVLVQGKRPADYSCGQRCLQNESEVLRI